MRPSVLRKSIRNFHLAFRTEPLYTQPLTQSDVDRLQYGTAKGIQYLLIRVIRDQLRADREQTEGLGGGCTR